MRIHSSKIKCLIRSPCPKFASQATSTGKTTVVWFASHLRRAPEQEMCISERAQQDGGSALPGEGHHAPSAGTHQEESIPKQL